MTKIDDAKRKAVAAYRKQQRGRGKLTTFEQVLLDVGCQTFAKGFDAAVRALKR